MPKGHKALPGGEGMLDWIKCSCGWDSGPFFDGMEYAENAWQRHLDREKAKKLKRGKNE